MIGMMLSLVIIYGFSALITIVLRGPIYKYFPPITQKEMQTLQDNTHHAAEVNSKDPYLDYGEAEVDILLSRKD